MSTAPAKYWTTGRAKHHRRSFLEIVSGDGEQCGPSNRPKQRAYFLDHGLFKYTDK